MVMRAASSTLWTAAFLLVIGLILPTARGLAAGPRTDRQTRSGVTVHVDRKSYSEHTPVKIEVSNGLGERIALPGCASFSLQKFGDNDFVPIPPHRCDWEQDAVTVPPGNHAFEFNPSHEERAIYRVVVTYGLGCHEAEPLSRAQCTRFGTAYSPTFVILPAPEP